MNQLEVPLLHYREGGLRGKMQLKLCQRERDVSSNIAKVWKRRSRIHFICLPDFPDKRKETRVRVKEKLQSALQALED